MLVHGGGPEINIWLKKLGIEAQFKDGLRVTDGEALLTLLSVVAGQVHMPGCPQIEIAVVLYALAWVLLLHRNQLAWTCIPKLSAESM